MNGDKIKREKRRKVEKSTLFIKLLRWNLFVTHKIFLGNVRDWKGPEEREPTRTTTESQHFASDTSPKHLCRLTQRLNTVQ